MGAAKGNGQNLGMFGTPTSKYKDLLEKEDIEELDNEGGDMIDPKTGKLVGIEEDYEEEDHKDRDEFDGRKSKVVGVYSNIDKQRMGESKKKTLKLTESQLINIIEKVVKERKK